MVSYRENLSSIIESCLKADVSVIIGTVPSNLMQPSLPGEHGKEYIKVLDYFEKGEWEKGRELAQHILQSKPRHQASDLENSIIRDLAEQYNLPLADVEKGVVDASPNGIPGNSLFLDDCHLNAAGNDILIKTFETEILRLYR